MSGKFIKLLLGPVHFETRFLSFIKTNRDTLHNYVYLVDNYHLYEPYKDLVEIIDLTEIAKNHAWSSEKEIPFAETDTTLYMKNFVEHCCINKNFLPSNVLRFHFLNSYDKNILNMMYVGNNIVLSNNQNTLDNFFNSTEPGTFTVPFLNFSPQPYFKGDYVSNLFKEKYPTLIIPEDYWYFDGYQFGFHFKTKEDMILFYEMWDHLMHLYYTDPNLNSHLGHPAGYTMFESFVGYVIRIFELNFDYKVAYLFDYWKKTGFHTSYPHDTWYYAGIRGGWERYGFRLDNTITTVQDYVDANKEPLKQYFNQHGFELQNEPPYTLSRVHEDLNWNL
jgi:hypothetical protein